jgi:hypothetical protein
MAEKKVWQVLSCELSTRIQIPLIHPPYVCVKCLRILAAGFRLQPDFVQRFHSCESLITHMVVQLVTEVGPDRQLPLWVFLWWQLHEYVTEYHKCRLQANYLVISLGLMVAFSDTSAAMHAHCGITWGAVQCNNQNFFIHYTQNDHHYAHLPEDLLLNSAPWILLWFLFSFH